MPRKTKEVQQTEIEVKNEVTKADKKPVVSKNKSAMSKNVRKTNGSSKKRTEKLVNKERDVSEKKDKKLSTKTTRSESESKTKKNKSTLKSTKAISTTSKISKINVEKKSSVKRKSTSKKSTKKLDIVEYYDLPYRYNQTIVKILAQTPTNLFIYWDISDEDRENYKKQFGENFFETTKPVLKIYNETMNYNFEVEINDFANSWYLHINDSKCDYRVELGRRPIYNPADIGGTDYVYISSSNKIESPNDRILIDKTQNMVYFRNVKTNQINKKSFANLSFIRNMGKIYNIYDLYKELYKDEDLEEIYNPSSKFF